MQADPTSPEHGQYGFLQDLVRHVAYETLSKKERRSRHLAAAAYLVDAFPNEDEITEVLASHYLDAYTALPDAEDAAEVKAKARAALVRAGDRAESLGAAGEALRYLEQAARLDRRPARASRAPRPRRLARLPTPQTGRRPSDCSASRSRSTRRTTTCGLQRGCPAVSRPSRVGRERSRRRSRGGKRHLQPWRSTSRERSSRVSRTALAGDYFFRGEKEKALEKAELAIELAESLGSPEILARAFSAKALVTHGRRPEEVDRTSPARTRDRPRARSPRTRGQRALQSLRPHVPARPLRRRPRLSRRCARGRAPPEAIGRRNGAFSARRRTPSSCSGAGTRRSPPSRRCRTERLLEGVTAGLPELTARDPRRAGRDRPGGARALSLRAPPGFGERPGPGLLPHRCRRGRARREPLRRSPPNRHRGR